MTTKKNARAEAGKDTHGNSKPKTRIIMVCPCCGDEVRHRRYGFNLIMASPFSACTWYVCDDCEAKLTGQDEAERTATVAAFLNYLEGTDHAPAP